jgi:hypothetical protein
MIPVTRLYWYRYILTFKNYKLCIIFVFLLKAVLRSDPELLGQVESDLKKSFLIRIRDRIKTIVFDNKNVYYFCELVLHSG